MNFAVESIRSPKAASSGALLAQFPPSFKWGDAECGYLTDLLRAFSGCRVAVELRHSSWSDRFADTLALLNAFEAAWTQIDEPKFRFSIRQNFLPNVRGFYYMRLHGRNAEKWWQHEKSEDRYDYRYSTEELKEFTETVTAARENREEGVSLHEQSLLGEVGGQRRDDQAAARRAAAGHSTDFVERYPERS